MKNRDSLLYYLGQLNSGETRRVVIVPDENNELIASLQEKKNGNWSEVNRAYLGFELQNQEDALPIVSKVEWDETTEQIQQRIPVKYLTKDHRPRTRTHIHGVKRGRKTLKKRSDEILKEISEGKRPPLFAFSIIEE